MGMCPVASAGPPALGTGQFGKAHSQRSAGITITVLLLPLLQPHKNSPYGRPGDAARLSLMIGMRALGRGLTSKLVSWTKLVSFWTLTTARSRRCSAHPFEEVADHLDKRRGIEARVRVVDEDHEVHVWLKM